MVVDSNSNNRNNNIPFNRITLLCICNTGNRTIGNKETKDNDVDDDNDDPMA